MAINALSVEVRQFVIALGSIATVDALLLLARRPDRFWTARQIASELQLHQRIEETLDHLARLGLVDVRLGSDVLYRYVSTERLDVLVEQLAHESEERRYLVLGALASLPRA